MARKTHNHRLDIPPLELECMKLLWSLGAATVHQVRAELLPTRPLAYTTVMTLMDRLARKGIAEREKRGRAYLYRPALAEQSARDFALDRFTRNFFRGSRDALREYLATSGAPALSPAPAPAPGARPAADPPLPLTATAPPPAQRAAHDRRVRSRRPPQAPAAIDPSLL